MANGSKFPSDRVAAAIRFGLREGRQPAELAPSEAEEKSATYRANLAHYLQHVGISLNQGDHLQAAEKAWGAYAQTIKNIAAEHGLSATHHASIIGAADQMAILAADYDDESGVFLRHGLSTARSLHQHFYENDLSPQTVAENATEVTRVIQFLSDLFSAEGDAA